ncbi:MAG: beta strand repeat-containing protein, partial [Candidatus Paceibacteria bacterium]
MTNYYPKITKAKKILIVFFTFLFLLSLFGTSFAQFNPEINYQGKLTNDLGVTVPNASYNMVFRLYSVPTGGTAIWTESRTGGNAVTTNSGLFSVMLGEVSSLVGLDFNQTLYLGVTVGGDAEMSPRKVLGAVPAAFVSQTAQLANDSLAVGGVASTSLVRNDDMGTIEASSSGTLFSLIQNGAGKIATFFAGATEVFTILNNGNVGIGTTTPAQKLSVVGNGLFTGTLTASNFSGSSVGTNTGDVTLAGENYLSLTGQQITASAINLAGTNVTGQLPYANLANGSALSVLGRGANSTGVNASITAGTDGFVLRRSGTTLAFGTLTNSSLAAGTFANITGTGALNAGSITSGFGSIDIGASTFTTIGTVSGGAGTFSSLTSPSLANAGALALSATGANIITASTNGVERLRITSAGNVGIGTTAPTAKLQVAGTSDIIQLILRNNTSQTTNLQEWQTSTGVTIASMSPTGVFRSNTGLFQGTNVAPLVVERTTAGSNIAMEFKNATASWFVGQGSNGNFGVSTSNNIGTSTLFNVTSTGNVGIGVIDPNARLTVSSNIGQLALLDANSTDTTSTGGTLIGTNDGLFTIQGVNSSGSGSAIRIAINQMNGNVGIGTTTPAQKLSVVGNGLFTGTLTASNFSGSSVGTNTGDVTLAGENYLSLTGQQITASAINLADTNVTGTLPVARGGTGITSLGTGVTTALGINIGTAGSFVTNGGALGTPSSATLTNATGLPIIAGTTGTLTIARGGTGATTAAVARTNLGATTIGANLFTLTNPSEVRFLRVNADNTVTARTADDFRSDIGVGTGSGSVTSVGLSAPTGFTVSGSPVTTSGTLALSFDTGYSLPLTASSTNWNTAFSWGNHATAGYLTATNNFSDLTNPATARTNLNVPTRTGVDASGTWGIAITGNASTATTLQTARTINGTSFNGSANITTANWGTARTLTIGGTGKSVNGSANIAWSLAEIGVDPAGTDNSTNVTLAGENYLSLTGQQITANAINLAGTNVTGTLPVARGGTGATTLTGVTIGNGTGALSAVTGTASQFLRRNAGNTAYEFATISPVLTLGTDLTGNATFTNLGNATLNATIANNAVTLAKFQQIATGSILGRNTAGTGNVEVLSTLPATVQGNITATGVLNSGSINTGFGNINIGASTFTTTGSASVGGLTVGGILNLNSASGLLARFGDSSHEDKYILFRNDFNNGTMFGYSDATISNTSGTGLIRTGSKAFAISTGDTSAFDSVTTANFVIDSTGRVGIATTTPTEMLSVVGNGLFSGSVTAPTFSGALTGNANTATTLQTARTIAISGGATGTATSFNGSANITIPITSLNAANLSGTVPNASISGTYTGLTNLTGSGDVDFARFLGNAADTATAPSFSWTGDTDTGMYRAGIDTLGLTTAGVARLTINATGVVNVPGSLTAGSFSGPLTGNASTATTLQTARTINGTSFNGSANITTANWGTARTLTIGGTGKSVNGSANIAWSLAEIGAAGEVHTHDTSDITTGTFVSARLSGSYTGITGTGALNAGSITSGFGNINIGTNTFTGNGSGLTTLNASNLSSGTVPNARISGSYTGLTNLTGSGNVDFARFLGNAADTAAAPSYSWTGDLDTGMYRPGADQIGFATGGTSRMFIDASGNVGVGTAAPVALLHLSRNLTDGERVIEFDVHRAFDIRRIGVTDGTANLVLNSRVSGNAWGVAHGGVEIVNFGTGGAVNFFQDVNTTGTFSGSGASLTALNASNLSSGTVPNARISGSYTGITGTGALNAGSINTGFGNINIGTNTFTGNGSG